MKTKKRKAQSVSNFDKYETFSLNRQELGNLKGGGKWIQLEDGSWIWVS